MQMYAVPVSYRRYEELVARSKINSCRAKVSDISLRKFVLDWLWVSMAGTGIDTIDKGNLEGEKKKSRE